MKLLLMAREKQRNFFLIKNRVAHMVMIRPGGKPQKIAEKVMKNKGVKLPKKKKNENEKSLLTGPYLQH